MTLQNFMRVGFPEVLLVHVALMCKWDPAELQLAAQCLRWDREGTA
jgi:hypothetical protein